MNESIVANSFAEATNLLRGLPRADKFCVYDAQGRELDNHKGIRIHGSDDYITVMRNQYWLVQHGDAVKHALDICSELGLNGKMKLNISENGAKLSAYLTFAGHTIKDDAKGISYGIKINNSLDGGGKLVVSAYGERLVCSNGMTVKTVFSEAAQRHIGEKNIHVVMMQLVKQAVNAEQRFVTIVEEAMKQSFAWSVLEQWLHSALKDGSVSIAHLETILKDLGVGVVLVQDKKNKRIKHVTFVKEKNFNGSKWALYNSVTYYATHEQSLSHALREKLQDFSEQVLLAPIEVA